MTWEESLEIVVVRTKHERYRELCADDHPDHGLWRAKMIGKATGVPPPPSYPPLATQAAGLASSLWDWFQAGLPVTSTVEAHRRQAICETCPLFDAAHRRCTVCGCPTAFKPWLATAVCPRGFWEQPATST